MKEKVIQTMKELPEEAFNDVDELVERIVLLHKIEKGEQDMKDGKFYSTEEAKTKLNKWLR